MENLLMMIGWVLVLYLSYKGVIMALEKMNEL